jgi:dienelactone hydrolase
VLEMARAGLPLTGVVSLHGGLSTPSPAPAGSGKVPILVLNGAADQGVTGEDIAAFGKEMDSAGADWQFVNFSGAVHCFAESDADSPPGCLYDPRAAKRAWKMMDNFLEERLGD